MNWLNRKNPKITHKDLSFKDYLNFKSLDLRSQGKGKMNYIEVVLAKKYNPDFKIENPPGQGYPGGTELCR